MLAGGVPKHSDEEAVGRAWEKKIEMVNSEHNLYLLT